LSVNKNGNLRPDGVSLAVPVPFGRFGGTYYWNPGGPNAPSFTITRSVGVPGFGLRSVFLRPGLSSQDTLGSGMSGNVSVGFPSVSINGTIPNGGHRPWDVRETSIEAGVGSPTAVAETTTMTPEQIAEHINRHIFGPAMGPEDELTPVERSLRRGVATVGPANELPTRFLGSRPANSLEDGMEGWSSPYLKGGTVDGQADAANTGAAAPPAASGRVPAVPYVPQVPAGTPGGISGLIAAATGNAPSDPARFRSPAGGLLGMIEDYMNNNATAGR